MIKIIILINIIICFVENGVWLLIMIEMIFVLLSVFLLWIIRFILRLSVILLKIVVSSKLFVIGFILCKMSVIIDMIVILYNVNSVNIFLIFW